MAAVKNSIVQYFVEGEDDKKMIDTLKTQMGLIKPGKVQVLNVVFFRFFGEYTAELRKVYCICRDDRYAFVAVIF